MAGRRVRIKTRFYVILAFALIALTVGAVLLFADRSGGVLRAGSLPIEIEAKAVIVRDEMCISVDKYDRVDFAVAEGETIYEGMPVATVYKWAYSDDMTQSLLSVESDIYAAQTALLAGVENADLANIELQINGKLEAIQALARGGAGDLLTLSRELDSLLAQRKTYLKDTVQPTEALNGLYSSSLTKTEQLDAYRTTVASLGTGTVSFYFDGYESALNCDKLDSVTSTLLSTVIATPGNVLGGASADLLYRLVDSSHWCIAFITDRGKPLRTVAGESYAVAIEGFGGSAFTGVAAETVISDGGVVNLLEMSGEIGALLCERTVNVVLTGAAEGLIVPLDAISVKDGKASILVETGEGEYQVEVDVLAQSESEAVVRSRDAVYSLAAGMRFVKP